MGSFELKRINSQDYDSAVFTRTLLIQLLVRVVVHSHEEKTCMTSPFDEEEQLGPIKLV